MRIFFRTTFVFLVVFFALLFQSSPANAVRCTYGYCELIGTLYDINPGCVVDHQGKRLGYCRYDLEYRTCDGPDCIPAEGMVVENPCMINGYCYPVHACDFCDSERWVTTEYETANLYWPWLCPMDECFWGDCSVFPPECSKGYNNCPTS